MTDQKLQVGIVGAGVMGVGITHAFTTSGADVVLVEPDPRQLEKAITKFEAVVANGVRRELLSDSDATQARQRLSTASSISELPERLEIVIEAVPEQATLKEKVLAEIAEVHPAIIGSNTSSISIELLARALPSPETFIGVHFFNPVWSMKLVEIVRGRNTREDIIKRCRSIVENLGKESIVTRDSPGFATSRLGLLLGLEAIRMVEEEIAEPADIDKAMVLGYGHPVGPLRLTDIVGLDVRLDISRNLVASFGERFSPPELLERMVEEGALGRKTGRGFYSWEAEAN